MTPEEIVKKLASMGLFSMCDSYGTEIEGLPVKEWMTKRIEDQYLMGWNRCIDAWYDDVVHKSDLNFKDEKTN